MLFILQLILRMVKYLVSGFSALSWAQVLFILVIVVLLVVFLIVAFKFWVFFDLPAPELPELGGVEETPSTAPAPGDSPSSTGGSTGGWPTWLWVAAGVGGIVLILVSSDLIIFGDQGYVMRGLRDLAGLFGGGPNGGQPGDLPAVPAVAQDAMPVNPQVVPQVEPRFLFEAPVISTEGAREIIEALRFLSSPEAIPYNTIYLRDPDRFRLLTDRLGLKANRYINVLASFKENLALQVSQGTFDEWAAPGVRVLRDKDLESFVGLCSRLGYDLVG